MSIRGEDTFTDEDEMGSSAEFALPAAARAPQLRVIRSTPPRRVGFVAAFELMGESVAVYGANGSLRHETARMRTIRENADASRLIRQALRVMAERVAAARPYGAVPAPVCLRDRSCVVRATLYQPADEPLLLIHADAEPDPLHDMTDDEIIAAFGLTPAELRVARLLALGKSNKQIAFDLGVSEHTTRHQTERVLRKMNVNSRSAVAPKLFARQAVSS